MNSDQTQPPSSHDRIEIARNNPAQLYDADYYQTSFSENPEQTYGRREPWTTFFANISAKIIRAYKPDTAVDIGCAFGLLVESLVDQGVDAYGFDISPFAIEQARDDMKGRLAVHAITDAIPLRNGKKYDVAICIEVLEHLPPEQADLAIANLCSCSDRVVFSSSPDDFDEPTHFNVLATEAWIEKFAAHDFVPARRGHMASYIAPQARAFEHKELKHPNVVSKLWVWLTGRGSA